MRAAGIPEAFWQSLRPYRMIGIEGTLAFIENDTKARRGYMSCPRTHTAKFRSYNIQFSVSHMRKKRLKEL